SRWSQLTCKPYGRISTRTDSLEDKSFSSRRLRQPAQGAHYPNPASGTSSLAATEVVVRHMMPIAAFENGQALRYPDCSVRIGQPDHAAPSLVNEANTARCKNQ